MPSPSVHPSQKTSPYDAVIIGTGQGGKPLARHFAREGLSTAIIERSHVGGTCVNVGCTPTKTMVASARIAHLARRAGDYGVHVDAVRVDLPAVRRRKQQIVDRFRNGSQRSLEKAENLDLIFGEASFTGPHTLAVQLTGGGSRTIEGKRIFINTGTRTAVPPVPGLDGVPFLDNAAIMELDTLPEHLLVMGGGYVGVEFGQMFRRFGSRVTLVHRGSQLLAREDGDVARSVARILAEDGIDLHLESEVTGAKQAGDGSIVLNVRGAGGATESIRGSHLLVATGRKPNSDALDLDAAGIQADERGFIRVDGRLATTSDGVYALGDVKGGPAFTHIAYDDYRILVVNLLEGGDESTRDRLVPYTVFIDPQLGRVGMSEREAERSGRRHLVAKMDMDSAARAIEAGETRGFMKVIIDADTQRILGCAILGMEGGEIMGVLQTAMMGDLPFTRIRDATYAHPTLTESLNNLFSGVEAPGTEAIDRGRPLAAAHG